MTITETTLPGVKLLTAKIFRDSRGAFSETFNQRQIEQAGLPSRWVQDNFSLSAKNVLRGIHYQITHPQGKLVRVTHGAVLDVAVDLRKSSPTFGKWVGKILSAENKKQLWIPEGFAHGFVTLSDSADVLYKTTDYWAPEFERSLAWNDPTLRIQWPHVGEPSLSAKDQIGKLFSEAECFT